MLYYRTPILRMLYANPTRSLRETYACESLHNRLGSGYYQRGERPLPLFCLGRFPV